MDENIRKLDTEIRLLESKININNKLIKEVEKDDIYRKVLNILSILFFFILNYQLYGKFINVFVSMFISLWCLVIPKGLNIMFFGTKRKNINKINKYIDENNNYINIIDKDKNMLYEISNKDNSYVYDSFRFNSCSYSNSRSKRKVLRK